MPRIARVVVPGFPHHVTQRGNRRQQTFFCDEDYRAYIDLMAEWCRRCGIALVHFSPDSKALATFVPRTLKVWNVAEWESDSKRQD